MQQKTSTALSDLQQSCKEKIQKSRQLPEYFFDHPDFHKFEFDYPRLLEVLEAGGTPLAAILSYGVEPWQILALLGEEGQLRKVYNSPLRDPTDPQRLDDPILDFVDGQNFGIADYYIIANRQRELLAWGKYYDPDFKGSDNLLLLGVAAVAGNISMIECLVTHYGYDIKRVNPFDNRSSSILYNAVQEGHRELVKWLIDQGVPYNLDDLLAVHAARYGRWDILDDLIERGLECTFDEDTYKAIIFNAICFGNNAVYRAMSIKGHVNVHDLNAFKKLGYFSQAILSGNLEMITCSLDKKTGWGSIEQKFDDDQTVLHMAARAGHATLIEDLLSKYPHKLDLSTTDKFGNNIVHLGSRRCCYYFTIELYEKFFVNLDIKKNNKTTFTSGLFMKKKIIPFSLFQPNKKGETIAHIGVGLNFLYLIKKNHGEEPLRAVDNENNTVLHHACYKGEVLTILWLTKVVGLSLTERNKEGDTPLHVLVKQARNREIPWHKFGIIAHRVDFSLITDYKNKKGDTVADLISSSTQKQLLDILAEKASVVKSKNITFTK